MKSQDIILYTLTAFALWILLKPKQSEFCGGCALMA
jgi:hypothetical protein